MAAKNNYPTTIQKILATACAVVLGFNLSGSILAQSNVADRFKDVKYVKTAEKKADEIEGELEIDKQNGGVRFLSKGSELVKVEKPQVTSLLYERTSRPRYVSGLLLAWPLLFTNALHQGEETLPDHPVQEQRGSGRIRAAPSG